MSSKKGSTAGGRATSAKRERYTPTGGGSGGPPVEARRPGTEAELRAAILAATSRYEQGEIAKAYILDHAAAGTVSFRGHLMAGHEDFRSFAFEGRKYLFSDATLEAAADSIYHRVAGFNKDVPESLRRHTKTIVFVSGVAGRHGPEPGVGASANGTSIVNYRGEHQAFAETHEMAHNLAPRLYGESLHPPAHSDFARARASGEPPPSKYGKTDVAEDFAESVRMYFHERHTLKQVAPKRHAVIKRLFEDPNYGG